METPLNPISAAIEMRATKKAVVILNGIFEDAVNFDRIEKRSNDPRDDYSV